MTVRTGYVAGLVEQALITRMNPCHVIVVVIVMFIVVIVHVRQVTVFLKVKKGVVTKLGTEKYKRAIREVELLKSTGKKGPGKRKKAKEHEKDGLDGPEDAAQKKKSKRKKGVVDSELKLEDRIYNDIC